MTAENWVNLASAELTARIDPMGAQLSVLRDRAGNELLWSGDPAVWSGRAPILFPIVGMLAGGHYRLGADSYALPRHGFARGSAFTIVHSSAHSAVFKLAADESTRRMYPFEFELDVRFAIEGPVLSVTTQIKNLDTRSMPASQGYHPAFRWPLPYGHARAAHFIEFTRQEAAHIRRLDPTGLLTPELHPTPLDASRLKLSDALFETDAVIFDEIRSRSVTYGAESGPRIEVGYSDAPYLGIWTKPGAEFICIEPWHGIADPQGYSGDFRDKPGIFTIAPGTHRDITMTITLLGA
jgi:galactose mutarotase-like enzyme